MHGTVRIGSRGRFTLPNELREIWKPKPGDTILWSVEDQVAIAELERRGRRVRGAPALLMARSARLIRNYEAKQIEGSI